LRHWVAARCVLYRLATWTTSQEYHSQHDHSCDVPFDSFHESTSLVRLTRAYLFGPLALCQQGKLGLLDSYGRLCFISTRSRFNFWLASAPTPATTETTPHTSLVSANLVTLGSSAFRPASRSTLALEDTLRLNGRLADGAEEITHWLLPPFCLLRSSPASVIRTPEIDCASSDGRTCT
jgi:hypothetical protein